MRRRSGIFDVRYEQDFAIFRTKLHWTSLTLLIIFLFAVLPFIVSLGFLSALTTMAITVIGAVGVNIATGYCGQIQIGQAGFVCLGGYISAMLMYHLKLPWLVTLPFSLIGTALVGLIFGLPSLRIKGFYIAMASIASYVVIIWVLMRGGSLTGGAEGIPVPLPSLFGIAIDTPIRLYWLTMVITVLAVAGAMNLVRGRTGRAFMAVRDNDIVAEHMGINVFKTKVTAFMVCAAYGALAGSLSAVVYGHIYYEQFPFIVNVWYLAYVVIGGMGSVTGAIFGVIFLKLLEYYVVIGGNILGNMLPVLGGSSAALVSITFGLILVGFLVYEPRGIYHKFDNVRRSLRIWPFPY